MMLSSLKLVDNSEPYYLVVGDCATRHIYKYLDTPYKIYSLQIQSGAGHQTGYAELKNCKAIYLFVSWANAISVIEDSEKVQDRLIIHKKIIAQLAELSVPVLFIDRHGFLDRYCGGLEEHAGDHGIDYGVALGAGWSPQSIITQVERRLEYRKSLIDQLPSNFRYYDLMDYVGMSTYRHESGECKHNVVNVAPWHYDLPSYFNAARAFSMFLSGDLNESFFLSWERDVVDIKRRGLVKI